jgi:hypothetical protein
MRSLFAVSIALLSALALSTPAFGTDDPSLPQKVKRAIDRGTALLVDLQESLDDDEVGDEWPYQGVYRVRGQIPVGYRIGGTSISAWALCEMPGWKKDKKRAKAVDRATRFVLTTLDDPLMVPESLSAYDVRGWGHAYALQFLVRLRALDRVPADLKTAVDERIPWLVDALETMEIKNHGGWNYARSKGDDSAPSTFMTAATLQALFAAHAAGEQVDAVVVERALSMLEQARLDTGSFQYAQRPPKDSERPTQGAIGRMPICETTLLLAGRGEVDRVRFALDDFFEHWQHLEDRRQKTGTHKKPYGVAPYYFFFAHGYAGQAIEMLEPDEREEYRERLRKVLWKVQERKTGGWNDRVFERSENYGTAMSLLALQAPLMPRPAGWAPSSETNAEGN